MYGGENLDYNEKKMKVLGLLARNGPMTPQEIAVRLRFYPIRAIYTYLRRQARNGLITRGRRFRRGQMIYALTDKGRARLAWLNSQLALTT